MKKIRVADYHGIVTICSPDLLKIFLTGKIRKIFLYYGSLPIITLFIDNNILNVII